MGNDMAQAMVGAGDGVMLRIRHHVKDAGFHLSEQLDKNTGAPMSAKDLTWSYATVLKAMPAQASLPTLLSGSNSAAHCSNQPGAFWQMQPCRRRHQDPR